jgi:uncharacterized protein YegP (UPF0339 family)
MKQPKFEVYPAKDGWRWRLVAANGRIIATGEAHTRKADAERALRTVVATAKVFKL